MIQVLTGVENDFRPGGAGGFYELNFKPDRSSPGNSPQKAHSGYT